MTGMKKGAGEDPFAEDDEDETETETVSDVETERGTASTRDSSQELQSDTESASTSGESRSTMQIPYKFRRNGVQDGRERVPLFLQEETKTEEREAGRELESRLDEDVTVTDLREALVKAGLSHLNDVEDQLEEWGYGMEFDN